MDRLETIRDHYSWAGPAKRTRFLLELIHGLTLLGREPGIAEAANEAIHVASSTALGVLDGKSSDDLGRIVARIPEERRKSFIEVTLRRVADSVVPETNPARVLFTIGGRSFPSGAFRTIEGLETAVADRKLTCLVVGVEVGKVYPEFFHEERGEAKVVEASLETADVSVFRVRAGVVDVHQGPARFVAPDGEEVWALNHGCPVPYAVWLSLSEAELEIHARSLKGTLTHYRLDHLAYDVEVEAGRFRPTKEHQFTSEFIASFTGGSTHYHYE